MALTPVNDIKSRSEVIINETQKEANTRQRVGSLFYDIADSFISFAGNGSQNPIAGNIYLNGNVVGNNNNAPLYIQGGGGIGLIAASDKNIMMSVSGSGKATYKGYEIVTKSDLNEYVPMSGTSSSNPLTGSIILNGSILNQSQNPLYIRGEVGLNLVSGSNKDINLTALGTGIATYNGAEIATKNDLYNYVPMSGTNPTTPITGYLALTGSIQNYSENPLSVQGSAGLNLISGSNRNITLNVSGTGIATYKGSEIMTKSDLDNSTIVISDNTKIGINPTITNFIQGQSGAFGNAKRVFITMNASDDSTGYLGVPHNQIRVEDMRAYYNRGDYSFSYYSENAGSLQKSTYIINPHNLFNVDFYNSDYSNSVGIKTGGADIYQVSGYYDPSAYNMRLTVLINTGIEI